MSISERNEQSVIRRQFAAWPFVLAILLLQAALHDLLYWGRIETNIVHPGQAAALQPLLSSDTLIFVMPIIFSAAVIAALLGVRGRDTMRLSVGVVGLASGLALMSFFAALLVAFNLWGS